MYIVLISDGKLLTNIIDHTQGKLTVFDPFRPFENIKIHHRNVCILSDFDNCIALSSIRVPFRFSLSISPLMAHEILL